MAAVTEDARTADGLDLQDRALMDLFRHSTRCRRVDVLREVFRAPWASDRVIADRAGCSVVTARKWRRRAGYYKITVRSQNLNFNVRLKPEWVRPR